MSAYVIAAVFLLLILVAGYLFLTHSIEKRRVARQRLITALRARRNSFRDLATGFPAGFLSSDLTGLLYRALIDCCEQLTRLEPQDPTHAEELVLYTNLLASLKDHQPPHARVRLENPQQIKEAHHLLQELNRFVMQQSTLQLINQVQTKAYTDQIKRLVLQISVDGHAFNARKAQQVGKPRLAIHHYTLARKALTTENASHTFDKQIAQLDSVIAKLQEKIDAAGDVNTQAAAAKAAAMADPSNKEWKHFDEENEKWKKKQIYD